MEKKHVSVYIVKISVPTSQWLAKGVVHIFNHLLFKSFSCIFLFSGQCINLTSINDIVTSDYK